MLHNTLYNTTEYHSALKRETETETKTVLQYMTTTDDAPGDDIMLSDISQSQKDKAWVAQWVKCPTLYLSSGLDLRITSSSPALGPMLDVEPTWGKKKKRQSVLFFSKIVKLKDKESTVVVADWGQRKQTVVQLI